MSPSPFGEHQRIVTDLAMWLGIAVMEAGCPAKPLVELDWIVRDDTVVRPDVMIICGDAPEKHQMEAPALVAEVLSPSTRQNDLNFKKSLYQQQGVNHYLIVDPMDAAISHLLLHDGAYVSAKWEGKLELKICEDCDLMVNLATIF